MKLGVLFHPHQFFPDIHKSWLRRCFVRRCMEDLLSVVEGKNNIPPTHTSLWSKTKVFFRFKSFPLFIRVSFNLEVSCNVYYLTFFQRYFYTLSSFLSEYFSLSHPNRLTHDFLLTLIYILAILLTYVAACISTPDSFRWWVLFPLSFHRPITNTPLLEQSKNIMRNKLTYLFGSTSTLSLREMSWV